MAPIGATTDTPAGATDSNMPTTDGSDTTRNQMPNTDSGTSNPDSSLPLATTKGEFLNLWYIVLQLVHFHILLGIAHFSWQVLCHIIMSMKFLASC
jgi:hypothetical protein